MKAKGLTRETIRNFDAVERTFPEFRVGDTIEVDQRVIEGEKTRIQTFTGDVLAKHICGNSSTFTVRRIGAHGVAVERIFPFASPLVEAIRLVSKGRVRRAKLFYIRDRIGKAAIIKKQEKSKKVVAQKVA